MPRTIPAAYKHSLWMRGLSPAELHRRYGFSKPLLAAFAKGREVSAGSLVRLAAVLKAHAPIPELVEILADEAAENEIASDESKAPEANGRVSGDSRSRVG